MKKLLAVLLAACCGLAMAQSYPNKPVRLIVPFPPGAATDITGRFLAQKLGEIWGQTLWDLRQNLLKKMSR